MKHTPRSYQLKCIDDCIKWIKSSVEPAVVEATVSFGKSLVIALLAKEVVMMSGKKVLILCPSGNLVKQNHAEVIGIGEPCSVFSASLKAKSTRHPITIGTPQSIRNSLSRFGSQFACIIIDEGEGLTESVKAICAQIKGCNPNVRIIGMTGTPYRTGTGYVYRLGLDGKPVPADSTIDPFYAQLIHKTTTKDLLDLGYLTPMIVGSVNVGKYDTSELVANAAGKFDRKAIDRAYHGKGRETSMIVADIIAQSQGRDGVMIFGATVQHCEEIMASLPPELSRMVTSKTRDNDKTLRAFSAQEFKYLVNVDMLTVGADFPHVSLIAVLRKTDSNRLLQQILGRGIRLLRDLWEIDPETPELRKAAIAASAKPDCLYLDYTTDNADTHYPDGDIWNPIIRAVPKKDGGGDVSCKCPLCDAENEFSARPNPDGFEYDKHGYFVDLQGVKIETEHGPMPSHFGRRCLNLIPIGGGKLGQCSYRWTSKECPTCGVECDIAARYCPNKHEIVDPNRALDVQYRQLKKDPYQRQCDVVTEWKVKDTVSQAGNEQYRIDVTTDHRAFSVWIMKNPKNSNAYSQLELYKRLDGNKPKTVVYVKEQSGFFRLISFDGDVDVNEADQTLLTYTA